jgi:hypothetical protein
MRGQHGNRTKLVWLGGLVVCRCGSAEGRLMFVVWRAPQLFFDNWIDRRRPIVKKATGRTIFDNGIIKKAKSHFRAAPVAGV